MPADTLDAASDLILYPSAATRPEARFPLRRADVGGFDRMVRGSPERWARALGAPVVMANQCGPLHTPPAPRPFPDIRSSFPACPRWWTATAPCVTGWAKKRGSQADG